MESLLVTHRPIKCPEDLVAVRALDTTFSTDRVYTVIAGDHAFILEVATMDPPLQKVYSLESLEDELPRLDTAIVAELEGIIVGFAAAKYTTWNRRLELVHIYIDAMHRGLGIGRTLLDAVIARGHSVSARCIWLETQNVNYPAIQFYRRAGFRLCGLDTSLYDPIGRAGGEIALFFQRELD